MESGQQVPIVTEDQRIKPIIEIDQIEEHSPDGIDVHGPQDSADYIQIKANSARKSVLRKGFSS